jgi:DNA-binding beta-propeller fold protein YncE
MRRSTCRHIRLVGASTLAALLCLCIASSANARVLAFWSNLGANKISAAPLIEEGNGADVPIASPYVDEPYGTAIDATAGRLYWLNRGGSGSIGYANLDGSSAGLLNTTGASFANPAGLAIDPAAGKVYWGNPEAGQESIGYANLNGSGGGLLKPAGASLEPNAVAVDPSAGRIYWSNFNANKISYANLDGTNAHDLDTGSAPVSGPEGVAVDSSKGRVYWANNTGNSLGYASANGGEGGEPQLNLAVTQPVGVAIDPLNQVLYWGNWGSVEDFQRLGVANLAGCCTTPLSIGSATQSDPSFPAILRSPSMAEFPKVEGRHRPGSTLTCSPGQWRGDQVESFYYRAPQGFAYQWLRNLKPIPGETSPTIAANKVGTYNCQVTASNFAGSDVEQSPIDFSVNATVTLKRATFNRKKGTAILRVAVTGSGRLDAYGKGVANASRKHVSGTAKVTIRASGKALIKLRNTGKAKVKATIAYTPEGGKAIKRRKAVVLKKKLGR